MSAAPDKLLPIQPAYQLPARSEAQRWLVTGLWLEQAVGVLGGEPKCCKSLLALDLAVAVASGTACLRHFPVPTAGRVLLYAAEDALHIVRRRLEGICVASQVSLQELDVQVITAPTVRLDLQADRDRLEHTVKELKPRLLVLNPFVRLHRIDENASGEVAPLLAYLRELQRRYQLAVLVVHHAKKGGARIRAGQALRGSSEFHAWGDSNLYLRRLENDLTLTVEHRATPSLPPIALELAQRGESLALEVRAPKHSVETSAHSSVEERILNALGRADRPVPAAELRTLCCVRKATFYTQLDELTRSGHLVRSAEGYRLSDTADSRFPVPVPVRSSRTPEPDSGTTSKSLFRVPSKSENVLTRRIAEP